jgi:hypothetical protein
MPIPLGLTTATLMLDIETEWTLNLSSKAFQRFRKPSFGHTSENQSHSVGVGGTHKNHHNFRRRFLRTSLPCSDSMNKKCPLLGGPVHQLISQFFPAWILAHPSHQPPGQ